MKFSQQRNNDKLDTVEKKISTTLEKLQYDLYKMKKRGERE